MYFPHNIIRDCPELALSIRLLKHPRPLHCDNPLVSQRSRAISQAWENLLSIRYRGTLSPMLHDFEVYSKQHVIRIRRYLCYTYGSGRQSSDSKVERAYRRQDRGSELHLSGMRISTLSSTVTCKQPRSRCCD